MTREQAEKLRQQRRKKRLRRKRIKAFSLLAFFIIVVFSVVFFAIKGIGYLKAGSESEDLENPIGSAGIVSDENSENGDGVISDSSDSSDENTTSDSTSDEGQAEQSKEPADSSDEAADSSTEEPVNTTPIGTKPEQSWSTLLVNQWSLMPEGYVPDVRRVYNCGADTGKDFDVRAADALEKMLSDARDAGYNMYLVSAYRTYDYQVGLFNRKVNEYKALGYDDDTAYSEASQWVAIPGTSEHCIGLAADIVSSTWYNYNSDLTHDFEDTDHFDWLYEHCAEYGFILRYPKGAEAITGITYEPWHYRFVGVDAAKYIMDNHITLEEFCAQ